MQVAHVQEDTMSLKMLWLRYVLGLEIIERVFSVKLRFFFFFLNLLCYILIHFVTDIQFIYNKYTALSK